jgi:uncharacterized protein (DUF302 family)
MQDAATSFARRMMSPRRLFAVVLGLCIAVPAGAEQSGLATRQSANSAPETVARFESAVRAAGWVVFTEIDHADAARAAGLDVPTRTVILFGNPSAGTGAMAEHPTLALDLPMRVLVWQDDMGRVFITRGTGEDIAERVFARHGIALPPESRSDTEALLDTLVAHAVE